MIKIEPSFPPLSVHKPHFLRMNHSPELGIYPSKRVVKPVLHMHRPGCRDCSIISFLCSPLDYWSLPTFSSVQFSRSVVSDSVRPHESQHARPPCPSPTPRVHSNSRPSSRWCHPAISSSVVPFSSCPQALPASGSFPMSQLFAWGGQSTWVSALAPFLPKKSQGWSPSEWTGWISLQSKGLSRVFSNATVQKHQYTHKHVYGEKDNLGSLILMTIKLISQYIITYLSISGHLDCFDFVWL